MVHMRRGDREITERPVVEAILRDGRWATIALADEDGPYVVTMSYGYDAQRQRLCFHAASKGRKLDIIRKNPRACATVVRDLGYIEGACEHPFESVVMSGTMHEVGDLDEKRVAMRTLIRQQEGSSEAHAVWQRNELDADDTYRRMSVLVFAIESTTAKRGK